MNLVHFWSELFKRRLKGKTNQKYIEKNTIILVNSAVLSPACMGASQRIIGGNFYRATAYALSAIWYRPSVRHTGGSQSKTVG